MISLNEFKIRNSLVPHNQLLNFELLKPNSFKYIKSYLNLIKIFRLFKF